MCSYRLTSNTIQSYSTQVRAYLGLAVRHGGLPLDRALTERELCLALILYAQAGHRPTTFAMFVSALSSWHNQQ